MDDQVPREATALVVSGEMKAASPTPCVSIILPTYNRADLLPRALSSVLEQDFPDFELIVIDNGSTAETQAVLLRFADPRMRCIRFDQNRGVGGARNEGVRQARGELIAFIDSDDAWLPGKLAHQVMLFDRYPELDIIFGNYRNINYVSRVDTYAFDHAREAMDQLQVRELEQGVFLVMAGLPEAMLRQSFLATPTVMLRSPVFGRLGNFNTALSGSEDFELWWRSALNKTSFGFTTRVLLDRHKDDDSLSSKPFIFLPQVQQALDICEATARKTGFPGLVPRLDHARARNWRAMIHACAREGRRRDAWTAFKKSLGYGVSIDSCVYFMAALAGPKMMGLARRVVARI